jgi:RNA polymerase sigma-70 factor (ECF subfamily)
MADLSHETAKLQTWIERLHAGDIGARDRLIDHTYGRLQRLTRRTLKGYPRLKQFDDTGDVLHNAVPQLLRALDEVKPVNLRDFFGLAATQIRRTLIDLTRHYYGPQGPGAREKSANPDGSESTPHDKSDTTHEPSRLAEWREFHEHVSKLPEKERQVFDLLYYHELSQPEAAKILQVSIGTVKARWRSARLKLHRVLKGKPEE